MRRLDHAGAADHVPVIDRQPRHAIALDAVGHGLHQVGLPGADAIGIALDEGQASRGEQVGKAARVAADGKVIGLVVGRHQGHRAVGVHIVGVHQLHQLDVGAAVQVLQIGHLEALDEDRRVGAVAVGGMQGVEQGVLEVAGRAALGQRHALHVGGMLDLGVDAHRAAELAAAGLGEVDHLVQRGHLELAVVGGGAAARLDGAQGLQLGQREVLDKPVVDALAVDRAGGLAAGEFRPLRDVGGAAEVRLVARHQHAVLGHHQVGFDVVGTERDGQVIALQRVLGPVAGRTPVRDHPRGAAVQGLPARRRRGSRLGGAGQHQAAHDRRQASQGDPQPRQVGRAGQAGLAGRGHGHRNSPQGLLGAQAQARRGWVRRWYSDR